MLPGSFPPPAAVTAGCATFGNRIVYPNVSESDLSEVRSTLEANATRPVSISAVTDPDTGEPVFDIIAVADEFGAAFLWGFSTGLTRADVTSTISIVPGRRLSAIDAYLGTDGTTRYAITWVNDGLTAEFSVGVTRSTLQDDDETHRNAGHRPVWIDGFHNGDNTRYSAIWVDDGITAEMDLRPLDPDAATDAWEDRTDEGQRMLRMTQFEVNIDGDSNNTETRRMSVWQTDNPTCDGRPWAAFTADSPVTFETTLVAQMVRPTRHFINDREIEVDLDDLPGLLSVGHLQASDNADLLRIIPQGTPADGTIAILQLAAPGRVSLLDVHLPTFEPENPPPGLADILDGNIRLRRWNVGGGVSNTDVDNDDACRFNALLSGCTGQTMRLTQFHNRIALAWDATEEVWREIKREGFLPDRYAPLATDAHLDNGNKRISSTWVGQDARFSRTEDLEPENGGSASDVALHNALPDFDSAILAHMRGRRIPHATLAIAVDGRVLTARRYSMVPENFLADTTVRPDTPFHIASISKPITALAIIRLVDTGALDLEMPLTDVPGVSDLIGTNWANIDISQLTTRMLLYHIGGWDRGIDQEISLSRDFEICDLMSSELPADMAGMFALAQQEPVAWEPGVKHAYSNFGYTILGRVIEAVTGQSYEEFVLEHILPPEISARYAMAPSRFPLANEEPVDVFLGYDVRNPLVTSVMGVPPLQTHPLREGCNSTHADRHLRTSGLYNTGLMDSHGGWIADTLATARLFSQVPNLMSENAFRQMVARPVGRETRIYQQTEPGNPNIDHTYQLARGRHPSGTSGLDLSTIPTGTRVFVGLGYNTFDSIDIELAAPATGGPIPITASYSGPGNALLSLEITDDGTQGLTQNGTITFDMPSDWSAQARDGETQSRFWVILRFGDVPGTTPVLDRVSVGGHVRRAMAFATSPSTWTLDVTNLSAPIPLFEIVGAVSQASANVTALTSASGSSTLTLQGKGQGSFLPGEALGTVGPNDPAFVEIGRVGDSREWPVVVDLEHGGALPGVDTLARRRGDGISWALFFAQGASSTPFYIPRGRDLLEEVIDDLIDMVPPNAWPGWDIAPD
ncbi:hypothetical protein GCM10007385_32320 [Tateyamaria omphalii]|uniref:serine hydrolase n=1 Tax=Tateyamaria omphalii TaxID=299262 RepID=UPI001678FCDF|nr:serine hydrolase [Tateyamaria omphalii]GGX60593.1 hypothetical protein GCM10007385_32320 [Tateyamaria omphalii]